MAETAPNPEVPSSLPELLARIRQLSVAELRAAAASIEGLLVAKVLVVFVVTNYRVVLLVSSVIDLGVSFDDDQNPFGISDAAKAKQRNTWD